MPSAGQQQTQQQASQAQSKKQEEVQAMQLQQGKAQSPGCKPQLQDTKKIDRRLMAIMQDQEKKDAQRSKGLIKGLIGQQLAGQEGEHCW